MRMRCSRASAVSTALAFLLTVSCAGRSEQREPAGKAGQGKEARKVAIRLSSPSFDQGGAIPVKHTCDGEDISPPLAWSGVPEGAKSLALICDDPDAPMKTWVHWVIYDIPADTTSLPENLPKSETVLGSAKQGKNDFGRTGYGGPCPPPGKPHRYYFKLYALDTELGLKPGATKRELLRAMEGHVLGEGQLMGTYKR